MDEIIQTALSQFPIVAIVAGIYWSHVRWLYRTIEHHRDCEAKLVTQIIKLSAEEN